MGGKSEIWGRILTCKCIKELKRENEKKDKQEMIEMKVYFLISKIFSKAFKFLSRLINLEVYVTHLD